MVKGISRQVIVVRSPDPKLFEQAIFILREDALGKDGMSARLSRRQAAMCLLESGGRCLWGRRCGQQAARWLRAWLGC